MQGEFTHGSKLYLFVMETSKREFAGLCGVESEIGSTEPFYNFKITRITQTSSVVKRKVEHSILNLVNDFQGEAELVSLYLHPDFRGQRSGEFLSRARLMFIAEFSELFSEMILAEVRGVSSEQGKSPFWEAVCKPFFEMDFVTADYLTVIEGRQFISDLMPRYPIYKDMLPIAAQEVIEQPHPMSAPAKHILEKEGLAYNNYIDIFDGGPLISGKKKKLKTIKHSKRCIISDIEKDLVSENLSMISNAKMEFKVKLGRAVIKEKAEDKNMGETGFKKQLADKNEAAAETQLPVAVIDQNTAARLKVTIGDIVRICTFI